MTRFPTEVEAVLRASGWAEGRQVPETSAEAIRIVCAEPGADGSRHESFPAAEIALAEFGGLFVRQDEPGVELRRRPFALDPTMAAATAATLADLGRLLAVRMFPLGVEGDGDAVLARVQRVPAQREIARERHADAPHQRVVDRARLRLLSGDRDSAP